MLRSYIEAKKYLSEVVQVPKVKRYNITHTNERQEDECGVLAQFQANVERHYISQSAEYVQPKRINC